MHCTVIGPNLHTSKIVTAISVSERLLEMAAFYTWLDFTLTLEMRVVIEHLLQFFIEGEQHSVCQIVKQCDAD